MTDYFNSDNYFEGYLGKDVVRSLLKTSGYIVCHYGYEDMFLDFKSKSNLLTSTSNTGRRIRKSPDLLVYDDTPLKSDCSNETPASALRNLK